MNTKGAAFTDDDLKLIKQIQEKLSAEQGKVSRTTAIRWALRKALASE